MNKKNFRDERKKSLFNPFEKKDRIPGLNLGDGDETYSDDE